MEQESLSKFISEIRRIWGPLDSGLIAKSRALMDQLAKAPFTEAWISEVKGSDKSIELYRDAEHGFVLLAHAERDGQYRAPHDHGNGWVIYTVQSGQMEMRTYGCIPKALVRRDEYKVNAGESRAYLPGDIHDTRCISDSVIMLRLTSCDLKKEKQEGRMHQYEEAAI